MKHLIPATTEMMVTIPAGMWFYRCCQENLCQSHGEEVEWLDVDTYYDTKNEALDALIASGVPFTEEDAMTVLDWAAWVRIGHGMLGLALQGRKSLQVKDGEVLVGENVL